MGSLDIRFRSRRCGGRCDRCGLRGNLTATGQCHVVVLGIAAGPVHRSPSGSSPEGRDRDRGDHPARGALTLAALLRWLGVHRGRTARRGSPAPLRAAGRWAREESRQSLRMARPRPGRRVPGWCSQWSTTDAIDAVTSSHCRRIADLVDHQADLQPGASDISSNSGTRMVIVIVHGVADDDRARVSAGCLRGKPSRRRSRQSAALLGESRAREARVDGGQW